MARNKIVWIFFLVLVSVFLPGCYNPPKYVCGCFAKCIDKENKPPNCVPNIPIGGNTPEDVLSQCRHSVESTCRKETHEIVSFSCNVKSWSEWNKEKDREIAQRQ